MQVKVTIETKNICIYIYIYIRAYIWVPSSRLKLLDTLKVAQVASVIIHSNSRSGLPVQSTRSRGGREMRKRDKSRGEVIPLARRITLFIFTLSIYVYTCTMIQYRRNVAFVLHATLSNILARNTLEEQTRLESGFSRRQTSVGGNKGGYANFNVSCR